MIRVSRVSSLGPGPFLRCLDSCWVFSTYINRYATRGVGYRGPGRLFYLTRASKSHQTVGIKGFKGVLIDTLRPKYPTLRPLGFRV